MTAKKKEAAPTAPADSSLEDRVAALEATVELLHECAHLRWAELSNPEALAHVRELAAERAAAEAGD